MFLFFSMHSPSWALTSVTPEFLNQVDYSPYEHCTFSLLLLPFTQIKQATKKEKTCKETKKTPTKHMFEEKKKVEKKKNRNIKEQKKKLT
eukprot:m.183519 g.183519  ORF g.183519 m.183519 type:complete len:90 (-) comp16653_c2_seq1:832-1101(-)